MSDASVRKVVTAARVLTAALILIQSAQFLQHAATPLHWIIGGTEIVAALLFMIEPALRAGAIGLIAVLSLRDRSPA